MVALPRGLTGSEARLRLERFGPNQIEPERPHPLRRFAALLWGPVPWLLEAALALELVLGRVVDASVVTALLLVNAAIGARQERRAEAALEALRSRLRVTARVLRDGSWDEISAAEIVPGDVVHVRMGDLTPADVELDDGALTVDQSALTGESLPVEATAGARIYAGSTVLRGEATGTVSATGKSTRFGRTAELVREARGRGPIDDVVASIVRYLGMVDAACALAILALMPVLHGDWRTILPFALILLVTAVPIALPAAFTVTTALASLALAERGVLVVRLAALERAAEMDVLCTDKTGTLTGNRLSVSAVVSYAPFDAQRVLELAALASDPATKDPFDVAILERAELAADARAGVVSLTPFDPATKRAGARVRLDGELIDVAKGAPPVIAAWAQEGGSAIVSDVRRLGAQGARVLAVAAGAPDRPRVAGLIAFSDPPRPEARAVIGALRERGIAVRMVTGDTEATARSVAAQLAIPEVDAGVYPEQKYGIVDALQRAGRVVGMTGDGVNDAPSLAKADVGVAVANATDVAKGAAGVVLTAAGLGALPAAVDAGREVQRRMLTWTLNKLVKAQQVALALTAGFFLTGGAMLTTPRLMLLMLFANDFVTLSLASDRVRGARTPQRWDVPRLLLAVAPLTACWTLFALGVFFAARGLLHLSMPQLQTLIFVAFVYTGQATVYQVREPGRFWTSRPGNWLMLSTVADLAVVTLLAHAGVLMAPVPAPALGALALAVAAALPVLDAVKRRFSPRPEPAPGLAREG